MIVYHYLCPIKLVKKFQKTLKTNRAKPFTRFLKKGDLVE